MICPYIEQAGGANVCECESLWNVVIEEHAKDTAAGLGIFAHFDLFMYSM